MFMAARAALWDTKVPRTRGVEYKAPKGGKGTVGSDAMEVDETVSGFDTRQLAKATDFELHDYWDEGEVLDGREGWPVCVTLNLVCILVLHASCALSRHRFLLPTFWTLHYQRKPLRHFNYFLYFHFRHHRRQYSKEYECLDRES